MLPRPPISTLFPYTTLFRSVEALGGQVRRLGQRLHDGERYPIPARRRRAEHAADDQVGKRSPDQRQAGVQVGRSEEHTSELQSRRDLVCRLLLEKKNKLCNR